MLFNNIKRTKFGPYFVFSSTIVAIKPPTFSLGTFASSFIPAISTMTVTTKNHLLRG